MDTAKRIVDAFNDFDHDMKSEDGQRIHDLLFHRTPRISGTVQEKTKQAKIDFINEILISMEMTESVARREAVEKTFTEPV